MKTGKFIEECGAEFERRADARYAAADHSHEAAAAPEMTPEPTAELAVTEYTVQAGDVLWAIARQLAGPATDYADFANRIAALNGIGADGALRIGQVLRIPQP